MNTIKTYKERLDANYPHPERHPEIVRQYVDEEITELRERVAYLESYTESQKDAMRVIMDELATVREALDCDRAVLAARTTSMNRFMQERDALQAKLSAIEAQEPSIVATEGMPSGMGNEPEILAEYTGFNGHRQWVNVGAWLYPGDCVAVLSEQVQPAHELTLENAPLGTKAPAYTGGHWVRVERGWKWSTGATFPRPGGDWDGRLIAPEAQPAQGEPDIADIIAGELQISRAHAYDKMRYALASAALLQSNAERVPLSDEQINRLWNDSFIGADPTSGNQRFKFARAIEAEITKGQQ